MQDKAAILVATEIVPDAELVRRLLSDEFDNICLSTDPARAVEDFERRSPAILLLAFNSLEKAERYYLGLYRLSARVHAIPHRTLILCNKKDLKRAYELCKKRYFDDYILFWPVPNDAFRLPMTVLHALRRMENDAGPTAGKFAAQAHRLSELEGLLEQHSTACDRHTEKAAGSVHHAKARVLAELDRLYAALTEGEPSKQAEVRDAAVLQQGLQHLRQEGIEKSFRAVDEALQPLRQWAEAFRSDLAPQLESARALRDLAMQVRPLVLVVDDDEFQHRLLAQLLVDENLELVFATSGSEAIGVLRQSKPDLILMDIKLPGDNGVEVTRRIKSVKRFADIPVIMITGKGAKNIVLDSMQAGAVAFIVKPFNKQTLIAKIQKVLTGH